ncbi:MULTISPECIES: hypothetical protein [unclassified Rhizobium]|uniref:hypothetical protein n=1 Tax=unclassified Rhizobium TaxID=2613769 RepID=UPI001043BF0B|nr:MULTISPECIES: hypothetical protein [unclassified Rhizobium]MBB3394937.1 hypothetical protein [Rhizobium sp. BK060]MBB4167464.1 hypothetical protein [Rhizobium sp. BK538]
MSPRSTADADFSQVFEAAALQGKTLSKSSVEAIIADKLIPDDEPLLIADLVTPGDLPVGLLGVGRRCAPPECQ